MINVLFFARYRELLGCDRLELAWQDDWRSVADIRDHLVRRGEPWTVLSEPTIMCAINQNMCQLDSSVAAGDELAFFPLVTGG